jgi:hypothetical protein
MLHVIKTSAKSLRDSRKATVNAAIRRWVESVKDTPDEERVDMLVRSEMVGVTQAYRNLVKGVNGSVPRLVETLFQEGERSALDSIEAELWSRTDKSAPPKVGTDYGVKLLLRFVSSKLFKFRNTTSFPAKNDDDSENTDAGACFAESLNFGLPKLRTPKGSISTSDAISGIEELLRGI